MTDDNSSDSQASGPKGRSSASEAEEGAMTADDCTFRSSTDYISAAEALSLLNVRPQTLYAYVSRGWIGSVSQPGVKEKLYRRIDVDRVRKRSVARSGHGAVAASAMDWGEPIFPTSITEITPQGPKYRGHLAADLVQDGASFEAVAELLWTGTLPEQEPRWPVRRKANSLSVLTEAISSREPHRNVLEIFAIVVLTLGLDHGSTEERLARGGSLPAAREVVQAIVACCGFLGPGQCYRPMQRGESILDGLAIALGLTPTAENYMAVRALLILLADHELPPGTLTARVVASAGASLQSCLASAFCATSGVELGRMYERVEDFLGHKATKPSLMRKARQQLARGLAVPGFHHPLYPSGDPRAALLLQLARNRHDLTREIRAVFGFMDEMIAEFGLRPRQELALVVLTRVLKLPSHCAPALFALARLPGWVAHVIEQRNDGSMLRPRAKFIASP